MPVFRMNGRIVPATTRADLLCEFEAATMQIYRVDHKNETVIVT